MLLRAESAQGQLKGNGSRKAEMRHWSIIELLEKHIDVDHAGYVADVTQLIKRVLLNDCYI